MSRNRHEDRSDSILRAVSPGTKRDQELSIPRGARRLDVVHRFVRAPVWFGPLAALCSERDVIFEFESGLVGRLKVRSALVGQSWLAWQQDRRTAPGTPRRAPIVIVVAARVITDARHLVPTLRPRQRVTGLWATSDLANGGLILLDASRLPDAAPWWFWSWLGMTVRGPERELRAARLLRSLLDHPTLPEDARDQLARDIMSGRTIHVSEAEQDSAWDRAVRQGMELGEQKGMRQGIQQGIQQGVRQGLDRARAALLAAAASHVPDRLPELERIDDIDELARAVAEALATR